MWLYASGFPKAQDVGKAIERREGKRNNNALGIKRSINESGPKTSCPKCKKTLNGSNQSKCVDTECPLKAEMAPADNEWAGWKTALKPAHEPIVMARKPFKGSCIDNVLTHGVGALNIDATRIPAEQDLIDWYNKYPEQKSKTGVYENYNPEVTVKVDNTQPIDKTEVQGRFPSNVIGEVEDYQKFFYCPKVNRAERSIGCDNLTQDYIETVAGSEGGKNGQWFCNVCSKSYNGSNNHTVCGDDKYWKESAPQGNNHPTVKPVALMKYLVKLVTPEGGKVLDPFTGSGSTGMAAVELGYDFTGCELDPNYVDIANNRITAWKNKTDLNNNPLPKEWFTE
tara:strand:- start:867 stop:1883 length:1017 start_codon:yes stop_codon:yes gene_type:complete